MKAKDTPTLQAALKALAALEQERKRDIPELRDGAEWARAFGLWADTRRAIALVRGIYKDESDE